MPARNWAIVVVLAAALSHESAAQIYRWDTGEVIPGTEGIAPGPGVDLQNRVLQYASFVGVNLSHASLRNANLEHAWFVESELFMTEMEGAIITGAHLGGVTSLESGFVKHQLYSTLSYRLKNLEGIDVSMNDLSGFDFSGQFLANANFKAAHVVGADFSGADLRGINGNLAADQFSGKNIVDEIGTVCEVTIAMGDCLDIRDYDGDQRNGHENPAYSIAVKESFEVNEDGRLRLTFEADPWDSLISFEHGIPVQLGGTLELSFADDVDVASQVGRTLHIFDWTGVSPAGKFTVASRYAWDTSRFYTTGEVTLIGVPELASSVLWGMACLALAVRRRRGTLFRGGIATIAALSAAMGAVGSTGHAATIFYDDFEDGSATDGSPVTWLPHPNPVFQGLYQVESGDYVIATKAQNDVAVALVPDITVSDVSIRTLVRMTGPGETGLLARGSATDETGYSAGIMTDGTLYLGWSNPTFHSLAQKKVNLDVRNDDIFLQLDVIGQRLALYAWRASDAMPHSPQLTAVDSRYASGVIGHLHWTRTQPAASLIRSVHVADSPIPEPSTLGMLVLAAADGMKRNSRRRLPSVR